MDFIVDLIESDKLIPSLSGRVNVQEETATFGEKNEGGLLRLDVKAKIIKTQC